MKIRFIKGSFTNTQAQTKSQSGGIVFNDLDTSIWVGGNHYLQIPKVEVVDLRASDSNITLLPSIYYILGTHTITLNPTSGILNEFVFETTGEVTFTTPIVWQDSAPNWTSGKTYQVSITYNSITNQYLGVYAEFDTSTN